MSEEKLTTEREAELLDLREVLKTVSGRRLLWRVLDWTGCEGTPKRSTQELTYMSIGTGDVGRWLKSEIISADENFLFTMMKENMEGMNVRTKGRNASSGNAGHRDTEGGNTES